LTGDPKQVFAQPGRIVLSASTAYAYFGADWRHKARTGIVFQFDDELYTLAGVAADAPEHSTVGIIILFIAIVNFINLSTARAVNRAKEVGVRKTIGAKRQMLIGQFLTESLLLTALAVCLGLALLFPLLSLLNGIAEKHLYIPLFNVGFWGLIIAFTVVIGCISGLYPAFYLSSFQPVKVLKGIVDARGGRIFWRSLVVGQFALSMILAIGTGIVWRQLQYIQHKKLGFDKSQLLYVRLVAGARSKVMLLKQDLLALPGVAQVAGGTGVLSDNTPSTTNVAWDGQAPKDRFLITQMNVDPDFLATTGMSLRTGHNFFPRGEVDSASNALVPYIINESCAKRMGYTAESAIGKHVSQRGLQGYVAAS
jgi:putative ABC transport system permease protein